ncbi:MAG: crossover junction endodeoxyribonuclease RuvC, partial [Planctomycetota bacterium]
SAWNPEVMALEQLFSHYDRPRTAILMGHARGVFCLAARQSGIQVRHFEPTKVKKVMTGNGRAPKSQMQRAVQLQLNLKSLPEPSDVADAMAIALCGHYLSDDSINQQLSL